MVTTILFLLCYHSNHSNAALSCMNYNYVKEKIYFKCYCEPRRLLKIKIINELFSTIPILRKIIHNKEYLKYIVPEARRFITGTQPFDYL
jgi:hypothetical protein